MSARRGLFSDFFPPDAPGSSSSDSASDLFDFFAAATSVSSVSSSCDSGADPIADPDEDLAGSSWFESISAASSRRVQSYVSADT